jgi:radical SAM superfamily enzyme YgiQ (UPF0313 family)
MKKIKRVVFVKPPQKGGTFYCALPLGLLSMASGLKQYGYDPILIDLYLYLIANNKSPDLIKQMAEKILSHNPDVLGFSVMCSTLPVTLLIAKECKRLAPKLPIILGGAEVSFEEVEVLKTFKQIDIIARGEAETTIVELLKSLENKKELSNVLGITFRKNNKIVRNPERPFMRDLDQLPLLDLSLLPQLDLYAAEIEAGRGCPYQCTFCATCRMWKRDFRMKSPQRLVQEMEQAQRHFKSPYIEIIHDHLLVSRKFAKEFLLLMKDKGIIWGCNSRLDALDESLIEGLKQAGCRLIHLGIETGSPTTQKKIKKNLPLEKLPRFLHLFSQNGIDFTLTFIIGFPGETESEINETLLMALSSKSAYSSIDVYIFLFIFLKGSESYNEAEGQYKYRETIASPMVTGLPDEVSLIKKYPHIFPSFYYVGSEWARAEIMNKMANLFSFLIRSYARQVLSLIRYLDITPYELGQKLISFFTAEGIDWSPSRSFTFPQFAPPLKRFIKKHANLLYKEFFWWDEKFERWNKKMARRKAKKH